MSGNEDTRAPEILIIRRKSGGEDDCHHGGAWKIAYADFMTAMMAFFLVMWLINAANDSVKASVASYFNPMRFTDSVARSKGLNDPKEQNNAKTEEKGESSGPSTTGKPGEAVKGAIDNAVEERRKLALNFDKAAPAVRREESTANAGAASLAGRAFRDPFNPQMPGQTMREGAASKESAASELSAKSPQESSESKAAARAPEPAGQMSTAADGKVQGRLGEAPQALPAPAAGPMQSADASAPKAEAGEVGNGPLAKTAAEVESRLRTAIERLGISGGPGLDVTVEGDGIVLSLTDTSNFGMFAIGSSNPEAELARLMQAIAPIVLANGDRVIVRGHTDSRPFRGDRSNNWRLSMERAEAAHAMLLKAGVEERRFERIEAHADQKPKNAADRDAAVNRRIEILLRRTKS